ncbi:hypothetical protein SAMN05660772_02101 [Pasteurella testudinis DSM 23072]|uniref:Uncharacterized protein n=1 Tax=Pasteurella testudinis DSM 23072 TaxID=1122938 RepID=A0A1W1UMV7_9PAST|nr:hypothetical protein [Pasteurella testudinis]SMB82417.1 hypothetical protein SAMN05660772_02101 [Pasteurella testudinis DSM 23072]SUB52213.1 Uncharacterised protein [Pasteurella testudinis]
MKKTEFPEVERFFSFLLVLASIIFTAPYWVLYFYFDLSPMETLIGGTAIYALIVILGACFNFSSSVNRAIDNLGKK